jgi:predicted RNA-binding protein with PIN domain
MKRYLVDGYNVIFSTHLKKLSTKEARDYLISFVKTNYPGKAIVVFDGREGIITEKGEDVVFTTSGSADQFIKSYVENNSKRESIVVVTRDRGIIGYVKSLGASIMQPDEFLKVKKRHPSLIKGILKPDEAKRITKELEKLWVDDDDTKG